MFMEFKITQMVKPIIHVTPIIDRIHAKIYNNYIVYLE